MKVVFLSPFLFRYLRGIERYTIGLANALAKKGVEVHLMTWDGGNPWPWEPLEPGVLLHPLKQFRYFESLWAGGKYAYLLKRFKPDILHIFFSWHGEEMALRLAPEFLNRTIPILHYPADYSLNRYVQLQKSRMIQYSQKIVSVSQYVQEGVSLRLQRESLVIPSGVDHDFFCPASDKKKLREALNIPDSKLIFLTAAALELQKNIDPALKVIASLAARNSNILYLIAGDGPDKEKFIQLSQDLNLTQHVRFLGAVNDVKNLYQLSDFFLLLSKGEAGPLAPLEAMASGLLPIILNVRPFDEYLNTQGVLLVNENTASNMAGVIQKFINQDKTILDGYRISNRNFVITNYDWSAIADQFVTLYQGIKV